MTLVDYLTKEYRTFEFIKQKAVVPSKTRKNGSTPPSKLPAQNTAGHLNPRTELPTTSSAIIMTHSLPPSEIVRIQAVVGGDHGETAFQFGAWASVELSDDRIIDFEVSVCELICRKDRGKLIKNTILIGLTQGLEILTTWNLNIEKNDDGDVKYWFSKDTKTTHTHIVDVYVTSDLAFQAMALGKESMSRWWCMLCKASRAKIYLGGGIIQQQESRFV